MANSRTPTRLSPAGIDESRRKAKILREALPYIRAFRGKTIVVKYGGSAMTEESLRESFAGDVSLLAMVGIRTAIVHGGGPQISRAMEQAGVRPQWVDGLRVTDAETMRVVQATLAGEINPDIVRLFAAHGVKAAGVTGIDCDLFVARARAPRLGFVGEIAAVQPALVQTLLEQQIVPVIAPVARGLDGAPYNLNADTAAAALALALRAEKLVYLTDVEGLYRDLGDPSSLISHVTVSGLEDLIADAPGAEGAGSAGGAPKRAVSAGMVPKLRSCIEAMRGGVGRTHILDGRVEHALLLEIFTPEGVGTMISQDPPPSAGEPAAHDVHGRETG